jgi:hypothetical protein
MKAPLNRFDEATLPSNRRNVRDAGRARKQGLSLVTFFGPAKKVTRLPGRDPAAPE